MDAPPPTPAGPPAAEMLALASEEMRGPLTSVAGYLHVLLDGEAGELTPGQARVAAVAARNADRLERLVDDLITIADVLGDGAPAAPAAPVDVAALVRSRLPEAERAARARGARVVCVLGPCPPVPGDGPLLGRMVECMLAGAVAFLGSGGTATVRLAADGGRAALEVSDDGLPLGRGEAAALLAGRAAPAAGPRALVASRLGLVLVRTVAERHGGRVALASSGGCTTLRVELPAPPPPAPGYGV